MIVLIAEYRRRRSIAARTRAILSSSFTDLAILDRNGVVEDCNDTWAAARRLRILSPRRNPANGGCLIRSTRAREDVAEIARVRDALGAVLSGREAERTLECDWRSGGERRSSHLRLAAWSVERGGAVVAHLDVTASKRVEIEAQRALHELAHMNMRAGMGELVSAVTHETDPIADRIARQRAGAQAHAPRPAGHARGPGAARRRHRRRQPRRHARHRTRPSAHAQGTVRHAAGRSERHRHGRRPGPELIGGQRRGRCWWRTSIPTSRRSTPIACSSARWR